MAKARKRRRVRLEDDIDRLFEIAAQQTREAMIEEELRNANALAAKVPPKRRGRPRKKINWTIVQGLIEINCTDAEIAASLGISPDILVSNPGAKRRKRDPHVELNWLIYRAHKERYAFRAAASLRRFWMQVFRGRLMDMDPETGQLIRTEVPLSFRMQAATVLSRQPAYLGFDAQMSAATKQLADGAPVPDAEGITITVRDKAALDAPKPIDIQAIRATVVVRDKSGAA